MKLFVIGDDFSVLGYSLAGIQGTAVKSRKEAAEALQEAMRDPDAGIILITQRIASEIQAQVNQAKLKTTIPVILEIPEQDKRRVTRRSGGGRIALYDPVPPNRP